MNETNAHPHVWSRLAAFDHPEPAGALCAFLEQHGFTARVYDERKLQRFWFFTRPMAGVCVQVPEISIPDARNFLQTQPETDRLLRTAVRCPSCKSTRVHYPQMTRKNVLPTLVAHGLVALGLMRHECYCEDCHFTWPRGATTAGRTNPSRNMPSFGTPKRSTHPRQPTNLTKP